MGRKWRPRGLALVIVSLAIGTGTLVVGCNDDDSDDDDPIGPCVHTYMDAVIHVEDARDRESNAPIDTVLISAASVDAHPYLLQWLVEETNASGVALSGDSLKCAVPFAFGIQEGHWALTVSASGYPWQTVEFDAHYAVFHGGCPSWNDGGSSVGLELTREPQRTAPQASQIDSARFTIEMDSMRDVDAAAEDSGLPSQTNPSVKRQ